MEIWKPITGHPNYQVSDEGRVRRKANERLLISHETETGYFTVRVDGGTYRVHRLVAAEFCSGEGPVVRHLDGNRANNNAINLRWGTNRQNVDDMRVHKTHAGTRATHCIYGHPLSGENLRYNNRGQRICSACARNRRRKHYAKSKGKAPDEVRKNRSKIPDPPTEHPIRTVPRIHGHKLLDKDVLPGFALCECGAKKEFAASRSRRREWHAEHRSQIKPLESHG